MWFLILPLLLPVPSALAQAPLCLPQREGMVACFEGRLCRCRLEPGGQLTGRPEGFRWDCGPLRPDCRPQEGRAPPPWPDWVPPPQMLLPPPERSPPAGSPPMVRP